MPVINLFGPPEPEDKNVVGTAAVINYFPKINLQGQLLWEQRPGLTAISQEQGLAGTLIQSGSPTLGQPAISQEQGLAGTLIQSGSPTLGQPAITLEIEEEGCIPIYYTWSDPGTQKWTVNVDGTLYGANLIQPESGIAALICWTRTTRFDSAPEGKKWTITGIYRNDTNSKLAISLTTMIDGDDGDYYELPLDHSLTSHRFHINLTSLYTIEFDSTFVTDPHVSIGDSLPDTENWIECIRIEENDFGAEAEATVIYD